MSSWYWALSVSSASKNVSVRRFCLFLLCATLCLTVVKAQETRRSDRTDDILRWVPLTATVGMKIAGVDSQSSWKRITVNGLSTLALTAGVTHCLKHTVHSMRPDGSDHYSFPSGHAALAFANATILHKEYGHTSKWVSISGYAVAAYTAYDRVRRDRHHWMDVIAGSAIGVAGGELGYWLGDKITGERKKGQMVFVPNGVYLSYTF